MNRGIINGTKKFKKIEYRNIFEEERAEERWKKLIRYRLGNEVKEGLY